MAKHPTLEQIRQKIDAVDKLFLLGSIPIVGNLFRHKTTKTENTELIIMITPTILGN